MNAGASRVTFGMLADEKQVGESLSLRNLKGGKRLDIDVPLKGVVAGDSRGNIYDPFPRYFVYGDPATAEVMETYRAPMAVRLLPEPRPEGVGDCPGSDS